MAIRCSRVFTGQQFSNGRATVPLDRGIGVETGHIELDESWQVTEYPTATVLPGLIDTHVILLRTVRWVPWIASRYGDEELDAVITEELQRQLAAGVTARDLGDLRYAVVNRRDVQRAGRTREPEPTIVASGPPLATELRSVQLPRPQGPRLPPRLGTSGPQQRCPPPRRHCPRPPRPGPDQPDQTTVHPIRRVPHAVDLPPRAEVPIRRQALPPSLVGDLTFGFKAFDIATDPGQSMTILTVETGSPQKKRSTSSQAGPQRSCPSRRPKHSAVTFPSADPPTGAGLRQNGKVYRVQSKGIYTQLLNSGAAGCQRGGAPPMRLHRDRKNQQA